MCGQISQVPYLSSSLFTNYYLALEYLSSSGKTITITSVHTSKLIIISLGEKKQFCLISLIFVYFVCFKESKEEASCPTLLTLQSIFFINGIKRWFTWLKIKRDLVLHNAQYMDMINAGDQKSSEKCCSAIVHHTNWVVMPMILWYIKLNRHRI